MAVGFAEVVMEGMASAGAVRVGRAVAGTARAGVELLAWTETGALEVTTGAIVGEEGLMDPGTEAARRSVEAEYPSTLNWRGGGAIDA